MKLIVSTSFVLLGALAGAGCKGQSQNASDGASARPVATTTLPNARQAAWAPPSPMPPEFTGTLTVERVVAAKSMLTAPQPEPKAFPLLVAQLGKPTKVLTGKHPLMGKEQKRFQWAAKSGTTCASYFVVEQPNMLADWPASIVEDLGGGTFEMPKAVPTSGGDGPALIDAWRGYLACVAVLGEQPGLPPDAPGAAGPGALSTEADIIAGLQRAPSKWLGKAVTVEGTVWPDDKRMAVDTAKGIVGCRPRAGVEVPKNDGKKHRVRGKVADPRLVDNWGFELEECELLR
jgi:hypothetical protein